MVVGEAPEPAESPGTRGAPVELRRMWTTGNEGATGRGGAGAHPLLAIAVLQILEVVVLPIWSQPHTQQWEPALLGHGRKVVSEASK